ncbi:MAG: hypothetical protein V2J25_15235 [Desulfatiglans sp.]|nr:hypothetical protein [Desulfatiglans sp.]
MAWYTIQNQAGKKLDYKVDNSIFPGTRAKPKLVSFIVSRFPSKYWGFVGYAINIGSDIVLIVLVYILSDGLFHKHLPINEAYYIFPPAFWVSLLFSTMPILFPITARLVSIKERTFGCLLCFIYFVLFGLGFIGGDYYFFFFNIIVANLIILSSTFALQYLVFTSVFLSLLYFNFIPVLILAISVLIGTFFIRNLGIYNILTRTIAHYRWYSKNPKGTTAFGRNNLKDMLLTPVYLFSNLKKFMNQVTQKNSFIIASYSIPSLLLILFYYVTEVDIYHQVAGNEILKYINNIMFSSILIFLITSLKPFLFLGQAERYFEYSSPFIAVLFVFIVISIKGIYLSKIILTVLCFQLCIILFNFIFPNRLKLWELISNPLGRENLKEIADVIKNMSNSLNILTIPAKLSFALSYSINNDDYKFFHNFVYRKGSGFTYMENDFLIYNYPRPDFGYFKERYAIDVVVLENKVLELANVGSQYSGFVDNLNKLYENEEFTIYSDERYHL